MRYYFVLLIHLFQYLILQNYSNLFDHRYLLLHCLCFLYHLTSLLLRHCFDKQDRRPNLPILLHYCYLLYLFDYLLSQNCSNLFDYRFLSLHYLYNQLNHNIHSEKLSRYYFVLLIHLFLYLILHLSSNLFDHRFQLLHCLYFLYHLTSL